MKLTRLQFPVRPAFVITANKSQGATLDRVALVIYEDVLAHGQLYVSLSRVRDFRNIKVWLPKFKKGILEEVVTNVVWPELLLEY